MKRRAVIETAVGETRAAVYEGRRMVELYVDRPWQKTPRTGDSYIGRVTTVDSSVAGAWVCLLYTSPSPRDQRGSRMPSSA